MGKLKWYKRDPVAALEGMAELTLEERGAYNTLIDLLYARDEDVPDDDVLVARMMSCHWRSWRAIKKRLIARKKVRVVDGKLSANRVHDTFMEASRRVQEWFKNGSGSFQESKKPNDFNKTAQKTAVHPDPDPEGSASPPPSRGEHDSLTPLPPRSLAQSLAHPDGLAPSLTVGDKLPKRRSLKTNPRTLKTNPRAQETNPRAKAREPPQEADELASHFLSPEASETILRERRKEFAKLQAEHIKKANRNGQ
jgi:hypothetical protein